MIKLPEEYKGYQVAIILFSTSYFDRAEAAVWLKRHGLSPEVEKGKIFWRARLMDISQAKECRIVRLEEGVYALLIR